ncbi:MAG TPA: fibronectin type III domain-containing protein [Verrucomicrobiae bacterium]|nr:fibronectin type III domain-containing protein [Verrucomicrobiae bacterium]
MWFGLLAGSSQLKASPGAAVVLAWDPSPDATVTGYNVYYGPASRTYTNVLAVGNATTAIVSNLCSGGTYYFAATTYTSAGMESDYSAEASYSVASPNVAPTLDPIADLNIPQDGPEQTVYLTGVTSGSASETQSLTVSAFSSNPGVIPQPAIDYSSPDPIGILTFTPVPGSYGSSVITVMVDDGATVSNTVIRSFTVSVIPVNNPPTIDLLSDVMLNENSGPMTINLTGITSGQTNLSANLSITASSSNPGVVPAPVVSYSNPSSTGSLLLAPATNAFGTSKITVTVSDSQPTNNTTSVSFQVTVSQAITPGVLTNAAVAPNSALRLVLNPPSASDKVSISLMPGAPAGLKLVSRRGITYIVWTPTPGQASTTNFVSVKIVDSTNPQMSTNETVQIVVQDYASLSLGSTSIQAGQSGSIPIMLSSSEGVTNLSFSMPWPNTLSNPTLSISAPGATNSSLKVQGNTVVVNVQSSSPQGFQGSNLLGSITFQSQRIQPSTLIALPVTQLTALKPSSASYWNTFLNSGQVAVINNVPIVQATATGGSGHALTVFGQVGNSYQVQYTTNLGPSAVWYPVSTYTQTSVSQSVPLAANLPWAFYRVQQK